ncbi:MAG: chemotaxis protein CheX [Clostridia bacterium]|nr:chemotaxis protein CheX [Clostridia bacterium]
MYRAATQWLLQTASVLVCEVTRQMSGIRLSNTSAPEQPSNEVVDTIAGYAGDDHAIQILLRAERRMLYRFAQNMLGEEPVDEEEVADFAKELFNVIGGRFISEVHRLSQTRTRMTPPAHYPHGRQHELMLYEPLVTLHFASECGERVEFCWSKQPIDTLLIKEREA